ncbi:hypothetical protein B0H17DRAFT_398540 [Mycena rosella]|uniref:Uncharacterized protein n=1 Tax=Mycena rosella TaxID=1033263 RepID=A0AAD7GMR8_MYCRO|nr:hypothetical protein B0H17DRAFT_398540 [Mycena rosella]
MVGWRKDSSPGLSLYSKSIHDADTRSNWHLRNLPSAVRSLVSQKMTRDKEKMRGSRRGKLAILVVDCKASESLQNSAEVLIVPGPSKKSRGLIVVNLEA